MYRSRSYCKYSKVVNSYLQSWAKSNVECLCFTYIALHNIQVMFSMVYVFYLLRKGIRKAKSKLYRNEHNSPFILNNECTKIHC